MTLPLTELGETYVQWMPRHLQGSTDVQYIMDVWSREHERMEDDRLDLLNQFFVQTATWGLKWWEAALQLPIEPDGIDIEDRRLLALAKLRANVAQRGIDFRAVIDTWVTDYTLRVDHDAGVLYVTISYNADAAYTEAQLETLIRSITPAHLDLNVVYSGFLADISEAEDPV